MSPSTPWRPMATAPETVARIWLDHLTLGPILAEGRDGRWYAPCAARQVWRWYRSAEPDGLDPFRGWLPYAALSVAPADPRAGGGLIPNPVDPFGMADLGFAQAPRGLGLIRTPLESSGARISGAPPSPSARQVPTAPSP